MIDFKTDDNGDLMIDPDTHDFVMISGIEEVSQRIKATLDIRYGEMVNLDPTMGSDYHNFLGKHFNPTNASADMTASITNNVPEVESVSNYKFKELPGRRLEVSFVATVRIEGSGTTQEVSEAYQIGQ